MGKLSNWFRGVTSGQKSDEQPTVFEVAEEQEENQQEMNKLSLTDEKFAPINLEFVLSITVPVGFQFSENEILRIYLSIDYSTLRLSQKTLYVAQEIIFEDDNDEHTLQCDIPIGKYYAVGTLFYNLVFGGAEPIDFLEATEKRKDSKYVSATGISYNDTLVINQKLGYGCPNQQVEEKFIFNVTVKTPYVVDENGQSIELEPVVSGNELPLLEAKCYGTYYGNRYLVNSKGTAVLYVPCQIVIENVEPIS